MMFFRSRLKNLSLMLDGQLTSRTASRLQNNPSVKKQLEIFSAMEKAMNFPGNPEDCERILANLPPACWSPRPCCGRFLAVTGNVYVQHEADEVISALEDMDIKCGDCIENASDGMAILELTDGSTLYLNHRTHLIFSETGPTLKLKAGQIFAMMRKQLKPFVIQSPSAELCVLGTEFDATVGEDGTTRLQVLKGSVEYRNAEGAVVVKQGEEVNPAKDCDEPVVQPMSKKAIYESKWRLGISTVRKENIFPMKKRLFVFTLLVLFLCAFYYFVEQTPKQPIASAVAAVAVSTTSSTLPVTLPETIATAEEKPIAWEIQMQFSGKDKAQQVYNSMMSLRTEYRGNMDQDKKITVTICDYKGDCSPSEAESMRAMIGRQVEYTVEKNGAINSLRMIDGNPIVGGKGLDAFFNALSMNGAEIIPYLAKRPVNESNWKVDEQWTSTFQHSLPDQSESMMTCHSTIQYKGIEVRDGITVAVFQKVYQVALGNIRWYEDKSGGVKTSVWLEKGDLSGFTEYLFDVKNQRMLSAHVRQDMKSIKIKVIMEIPNLAPVVQYREEGPKEGEVKVLYYYEKPM